MLLWLPGDVEGEADSLLAAGSILVLRGELDEARSLAAKAQLILSEEPHDRALEHCLPCSPHRSAKSPLA